MGGTFDPIHKGHLMLGEYAYKQYGLDKVWFMPNGTPPHKDNAKIGTSAKNRMEMVELAIAGRDEFELQTYEILNQETNYSYKSDQLTVPASMDQYYITGVNSSTKTFNASWENHSTAQQGGGRPGGPGGGMGGPNEGSSNKADYSCKGIKADNSITINGGTIEVKSHDDAIHTNSDVQLASGSYGKANIDINGGTITLYSDDDALHADGNLTVNDGNVVITNSYEGVEGNNIYFKGGSVQIKSSDDGLNAKTTLNFNP